MASTNKRPGRPAGGDGGNRDRIVAAAREEFAAKGFRGATMRAIAVQAGFDVALLAHYFGNKAGLFAATIALPDQALDLLVGALSGDPTTEGERLSRGYLTLWEDATTGPQLQVIARSAFGDETGAASLQTLITGVLVGPEVGPLLKGRETGFTLAMAHLMGIAIARHLEHVPPVAALAFDDLVARVAPATQHYLSSDGPG